MKPKSSKKHKPKGPVRFVTEFVHYRTKKLMRAADYGLKAWPIPVRGK